MKRLTYITPYLLPVIHLVVGGIIGFILSWDREINCPTPLARYPSSSNVVVAMAGMIEGDVGVETAVWVSTGETAVSSPPHAAKSF
ncbi:MAG: hypothetical protein GY943_24035 [Chloroflexi bacterium]|nr:hypothetical protein [Chloroflexota bacterium]